MPEGFPPTGAPDIFLKIRPAMSQCYHIELKSAVVRTVKGEDSVSYPIELTDILPADEMKDLLRQQLKDTGWEAQNSEETIFVTEGPGGESLTLDLETMEVTASITTEREVVAEALVQGRGESHQQAQQNAAHQLQEEESMLGDKIEDQGNRELQDEVTSRLAESEADRQRLINEVLQGVYSESLKRKAGQLGDIMEISESTGEDGNYELTIRVSQ